MIHGEAMDEENFTIQKNHLGASGPSIGKRRDWAKMGL